MARKKSSSKAAEILGDFDELPNAALVDRHTVEAIFDVSVATIWRWVESGTLPKPRKFGANVVRWNVGELRAVLSGLQVAA